MYLLFTNYIYSTRKVGYFPHTVGMYVRSKCIATAKNTTNLLQLADYVCVSIFAHYLLERPQINNY